MIDDDQSETRPDSEIIQESDEILAAFERVKKARAELIERRTGRKINKKDSVYWKPHANDE